MELVYNPQAELERVASDVNRARELMRFADESGWTEDMFWPAIDVLNRRRPEFFTKHEWIQPQEPNRVGVAALG